MIDTANLHSRIASRALDYLAELYPSEKIAPAGTDRWRIGSRGSLAISIKENALVFYSHEEGVGGDAVALWQRQRGGSIGDAIKGAAGWAGLADDGQQSERAPDRRKRSPKPKPVPPLMLDADHLEEARRNVLRLAGDPPLYERIATARKWRKETVLSVAIEGNIGWSDGWTADGYEWHRGALVFIYGSGLKHRWRRGDRRMIRWAVGKPATLWRGSIIKPTTEKVFVTEGETDALALLDAGAENDPRVAVVGLPNAGVIPWGIADQLAGRDVIMCHDDDEAGRRAMTKLAVLLRPVVSSLKVWGGAH